MKINLITKEEFDVLMDIFTNYPNLSLQNKGYETINKSNLSVDELSKIDVVTNILKKSIFGFSRFQNFRVKPTTNQPQIRLQYNWSYDGGLPFTGVGYILIEELLNGFNEK
jgi:hypothetical protein